MKKQPLVSAVVFVYYYISRTTLSTDKRCIHFPVIFYNFTDHIHENPKGVISLPIHKKSVSIECNPSTPAQLTKEMLSEKLHNIGLTCAYTTPESAGKLMDEVCCNLVKGSNEAFSILEVSDLNTLLLHLATNSNDLSLDSLSAYGATPISASWSPSQNALGYSAQLAAVIHPSSYWWLKQRYTNFMAHDIGPTSKTQSNTTVVAIEDFFGSTLATIAASVVDNLAIGDMKAMCTHMLGSAPDQQQDYHTHNTFIINLVNNYNASAQEADDIGVITLDLDLTVCNYKKNKKTHPKHKSVIKLSTRSVTYDDTDILEEHYNLVKTITNGFQNLHRLKGASHPRIYSALPALSMDLLIEGIPLASTQDAVKSLVLYQPEEKLIKHVDNTTCDQPLEGSCETTYGLDCKESMVPEAANCPILSSNDGQVTFFTDHLLQAHTGQLRYTVPAGKAISIYQQYYAYAIISLDLKTNTLAVEQTGTYGNNHFVIKED